METRLLLVVLPAAAVEQVLKIFESCAVLDTWLTDELTEEQDRVVIHALLPADSVSAAMDELAREDKFEGEIRVVLSSVQATLPRPPEPEDRSENEKPSSESVNRFFGNLSVTTEELVTDVSSSARLRPINLVMVGISSVVAAVGLLQNNVAAVIGAMVIAPLIGPNVSLALSTALGDPKMAMRSSIAGLAGISLAVAIGMVAGLLVTVDVGLGEISLRTEIGFAAVLIAVASGAAAALAFTTGISTTLIGVMVAVALLPPAVTLGLMIGSRNWELAGDSGLLLLINVAAINLAAVVVFFLQGVRPATYWEADRAKRAMKVAVASWVLAIVLLSVAIWFARGK